MPGYEMPAVDGELCEDWPLYVHGADGLPQLIHHSAREFASQADAVGTLTEDVS